MIKTFLTHTSGQIIPLRADLARLPTACHMNAGNAIPRKKTLPLSRHAPEGDFWQSAASVNIRCAQMRRTRDQRAPCGISQQSILLTNDGQAYIVISPACRLAD